jgi:phage terminase small subunit
MSDKSKLTDKQRAFIEHYLQCWNAAEAARRAGYSARIANRIGYENLRKPAIREEVEARLGKHAMEADEVLKRLAELARSSLGDFISVTGPSNWEVDLHRAEQAKKLGLIRRLWVDKEGQVRIELHDPLRALEMLGKALDVFSEEAGDGQVILQVVYGKEK